MTESAKQPAVIHPFLLGLYTLVALIAANVDQVSGSDVPRSFVWVLGATASLFLLVYLLVRNWGKAGLVCTLTLALFFSWGHVFRPMDGRIVGGILVGRADILMAVWAALWIFGTWWIIRVMKPARVPGWTKYMNMFAAIALALPVIQVLNFARQTARVGNITAQESFDPIPLPAALPDELPDVYYIILDGYGRADVLQDLYGYDNAAFIQFLQSRGFYVATQSHSNYAQTSLSLSSALNLSYINELAARLSEGSTSREPLAAAIRHSRIRDFLSRAGYQTVALASGYTVTELTDADWYLSEGNTLNTFEGMWLTSSAAAVVIDKLKPAWYRTLLLNNLDTLAQMPDTGSPRFVFAHILIPHPPFVFGPNGEAIPPVSFKEGNYYTGTIEEYIAGYQGQVAFLNSRLMTAIDGIIAGSDPKPIIILQGDHGPGAYLNWDTMEDNCFRERMSVLNAYYLPNVSEDRLYESISPVNSFRVILDSLFHTELGSLEDKSYFSLWNSLYQLEDITGRLDTCDVQTGS